MADILEAAIRVLRRDGGARFTTIRVAEEAGVSVGSLYQYFPDKAALLLKLQTDEWEATSRLLAEVLGRPDVPVVERWRQLVLVFFETEAEEAPLRRSLAEAAPELRHSPEAKRHEARVRPLLEQFFTEALPGQPAAEVAFTAEFFTTALGAIAERVTDRPLSRRELTAWATATAELMTGQLRRLRRSASAV